MYSFWKKMYCYVNTLICRTPMPIQTIKTTWLIIFILIAQQPDRIVAACGDSQMMCADGLCIPTLWKCDGEMDCRGGEDEAQQVCACGNIEMLCRDGSCISTWLMCNGKADCPDGDDETQERCEGGGCRDNEFRCLDGKCIPDLWWCDGTKDCINGTDELDCDPITTTNTPKPASHDPGTTTDTPKPTFHDPRATTNTPKPTFHVRPHLLESDITGTLNNISLENVKLFCYVNSMDGRSFVSYSAVSNGLMTSLPFVLYEISSVIGWLFAVPEDTNGYAYTDGKFRRTATITFDNGNNVTIQQFFPGGGGKYTMKVVTYVEGTAPVIEVDSSPVMAAHTETFQRINQVLLESSANRTLKIGSKTITYTAQQHILFDAIGTEYNGTSTETMYLKINAISVAIDKANRLARITMATKMANSKDWLTTADTTTSKNHTRTTKDKDIPMQNTIKVVSMGDTDSGSRSTLTVPLIIGGLSGLVLIIIVGVAVVCRRRRTEQHAHIRGEQVNSIGHPTDNNEYMEMTDERIYDEIKPDTCTTEYSYVHSPSAQCSDTMNMQNGHAACGSDYYLTPCKESCQNDYEVPINLAKT